MVSENAITAQGADMIRELLPGGKKLIFTRAVGGSGHSNELSALTALPSENQTLALTGIVSGENGSMIGVRVSSDGLQNGYTLRQIGLYAKVDETGTEALFQIAQSDTGVTVPAQSDTTGMTLDIRLGVEVDIGDAVVMLDSSAYVTTGQLQNTLGDVVRTRGRVSFTVASWDWENGDWFNASGDAIRGLPWRATVSNDRFSGDYVPHVFFHPGALPIARQFGVSGHCDMENGTLYLYAQEKPLTLLLGEVLMLIADSSAISGETVVNGGAWGDLFTLS